MLFYFLILRRVFMSVSESLTHRRMLRLILLMALGLRLVAACGLQYLLETRWHRDFLIPGDAEGYWQLAQQIASGEGYAIYDPPRYALRMPGFPLVLAIPVALFGPSLFAARLFLAGVGTLACWLTYRLGKRLFSPQAGLIAAGVAAVSPVMVIFTETLLSETAFAVTLLWSLLAGDRLFQQLATEQVLNRTMIRDACEAGVAIAVGIAMRPSWILAGPIMAGLLILLTPSFQKAVISGLVVIGTMVLVLFPWGIRNQQVTGHFTLTTFWMGPSLYDGLNPEATGDSNMAFYDRDQLMRSMGEYEVDQHYRRAAWKFAADHPWRTIQLAWAKTLRYWSPWPNAEQFSQWWAKVVVTLFFLPVLFLSIREGFYLSIRSGKGANRACWRRKIWSLAILAGPVFYFALIHMVFVSSLRYRLPAEYPLLVLAAQGWIHLRPVHQRQET